MAMTEYPAGRLDNIGFVAIFTRYQGKWVYCWHKRRESYEHPAGHVEPNETPMEAAKRELFEETGIKDCKIIPLWDYEYIWDNGAGSNNGRVFYAEVNSLGVLPKSEMDHTRLFDTVPENYTYNRDDELADIEKIEKILKAYI
ncbi:MAG: NUDIX domain-containing protein [Lachnospiraceae bacterium]|nr:NUDIX domain-containing protein [Lachnospiraceae bacterium]